jgi:hypothetical protein
VVEEVRERRRRTDIIRRGHIIIDILPAQPKV